MTAALFFLGLLAGEELIIRWGVQPALAALADAAHVAARIALVKRLKVIVPILIVPAVGTAIYATVAGRGVARWAGLAVLAAFVLLSAFGTVPINMRINDWDPAAPPPGWRALVRRWEVVDVFRSAAAVLAFLLFVASA